MKVVEAPPVDPRIRRTRQMLFQAFLELLAEKNFEAITVQDIAERSTVNRATFYDHFSDKFALLENMIGERFQGMINARMAGTDGSCQEGLRRLILGTCDFFAEVAAGCQKHQRQFEPIAESRVKQIVSEFLLAGLRKKDAPDAEVRATMASWALTGAALLWSKGQRLSPEALVELVLPVLRTAMCFGDAGTRDQGV